jgi:hypothetical protein
MPQKKVNTSHYQQGLFDELEKLQELRKEQTHYFPWEKIYFFKDRAQLTFTKMKMFKTIPLKGSLEILNDIKDEYFRKLHPKPVKMFYYDNAFDMRLSIDWQRVCELIEPAIEFMQFRIHREPKPRFGKFEQLSPEHLSLLWSEKISRSVFLKYLASRQSSAYKIIPVIEYQNGMREESFIFRLRTLSGRILIVWENGNPGRATHLFIAEQNNVDDRLAFIESYVMNSLNGKRLLLHEHDAEARQVKKTLHFIQSLSHDELSNYKTELQTVLNRY